MLTKDSVTVAVDAVVYYRVQNACTSITNVEDANRSTRLLAQTTLRNVLGTKNLSEILSEREAISNFMQVSHLSVVCVRLSFWRLSILNIGIKIHVLVSRISNIFGCGCHVQDKILSGKGHITHNFIRECSIVDFLSDY